MRIRIWNAFASNNSGSYTLVGSFASAETAQQAAAELQKVCEEHTAWRESWDGNSSAQSSPLAHFIQMHNLGTELDEGARDDWPDYGSPPELLVLDTQLVLYVGWTVTMPRTFGAFIYRRGGRVQTELDHAHAPIVTNAMIWMDGYCKASDKEWRTQCGSLIEALRRGALRPFLEWPKEREKAPSELFIGQNKYGSLALGTVLRI